MIGLMAQGWRIEFTSQSYGFCCWLSHDNFGKDFIASPGLSPEDSLNRAYAQLMDVMSK